MFKVLVQRLEEILLKMKNQNFEWTMSNVKEMKSLCLLVNTVGSITYIQHAQCIEKELESAVKVHMPRR